MPNQLAKWFLDFGTDYIISNKPVSKLNAKIESLMPKAVSVVAAPSNLSSRQLADQAKTIAELRSMVGAYDGCAIKRVAANTVFGDGSTSAEIMMIGEAPGASEDKEGIPFCGQSGKLLNSILKAMGYNREDVYITNTVFWRPPGNRRPTQEEIELCRPFVEKHIALIKPKLIVLVGSTAVEGLLGSKVSMHDLRGSSHEYTNKYLSEPIKTTVIFHPSYLLRQPSKKKLMWYDMLMVQKSLAA
jgi:uracil-DNA glycosylase family 4